MLAQADALAGARDAGPVCIAVGIAVGITDDKSGHWFKRAGNRQQRLDESVPMVRGTPLTHECAHVVYSRLAQDAGPVVGP